MVGLSIKELAVYDNVNEAMVYWGTEAASMAIGPGICLECFSITGYVQIPHITLIY